MDGSSSINSSSSASCWTKCCCSCPQPQQGKMDGRHVSPTQTGGEPEKVIDTQPRSQDPQTDLDDRHVDSNPEPETEPSTVV